MGRQAFFFFFVGEEAKSIATLVVVNLADKMKIGQAALKCLWVGQRPLSVALQEVQKGGASSAGASRWVVAAIVQSPRCARCLGEQTFVTIP